MYGTMDNLNKAVADGEVVVKEDKGVKYYFWREMEFGTKQGNHESEQVIAGKKITPEIHAMLKGAMKNLNWDFKLSDKENKAIENGQLPDKAEVKLVKANSLLTRK